MNEEIFFTVGDAKRDKKDKRDYRASGIIPTLLDIPKQVFNLDELFPPKNQFSRGSCTSQAQAHHKERQEKRASAARFVMALTKKLENNTEYGAYCLDDKTEILTTDGWKKRKDFNKGDKHFTVNLKTKELEIKKAIDKIEYDYDGKLLQFKNRSCDLLLTPNHKCITHYLNNHDNWRMKEARDVSTSDSFPLRTKGWKENKIKEYDDDLVELIGWIISEGSYEKQKTGNISRINITQNSGDNLDRIIELCNNLKLNFSLQKRKTRIRCDVRIYADSARYIEKILPESKCLPLDFMLKLTHEQLIILRESILSGDGYTDRGGRGLIQKSEKIIDNFQMLISLIGNSSSKQRRLQIDRCFTVRIKKAMCSCNPLYKKEINYKGKVWCPTNENGTIIVRRNGKTMITGQTRNSFVVVKENGICSESLYPEPSREMSWEEYIDVNKIPKECYEDAKNHKSKSYWRVEKDLDEIKSLLLQNKESIVCSMAWHKEFNRPIGGILPVNFTGDGAGHAVELKGWDDFNERLIFKNSWGVSWGDKGYFYMPFSIINKVIWDLWTSIDIQEELPVDKYYGEKRTWANYVLEKSFAFNPWLFKQINRLPSNREIKGLAYGKWDFETVFRGAHGEMWLKVTKPEAIKKGLI